MKRFIRRLAVALTAAALSVGALSAPPAHAYGRADTTIRDVLLVHGFDGGTGDPGHNCATYFRKLPSFLKTTMKWYGRVRTVGYYYDNVNCNEQIGNYGRQDSIRTIGKKFAWHVYNNYTSKGKIIDVAAHSMGGLVVRDAIAGVAEGWKGYPSKLYIEDVVTINTPHLGTDVYFLGSLSTQAKEMKKGSSFLAGLPQNPQAKYRTDWSLIGSVDDGYVPIQSSVKGPAAAHKLWFHKGQGLGHSTIMDFASGSSWDYTYKNNSGAWTTTHSGTSPMKRVYYGLQRHASW